MDSCLVSKVQTGGSSVMVWKIFSWCALGHVILIKDSLNATAYPGIVVDHLSQFVTTVFTHPLVATFTPCHKL